MRIGENSKDWKDWIRPGRVRIPPGLVLSFQRFPWPEEGVIERAPASLGALPVGLGSENEFILPLARDECFWIGLSVDPPLSRAALAVEAELRNGEELDAISGTTWSESGHAFVILPDTPWVQGIRCKDGGYYVFARDSNQSCETLCDRVRFRIERSGEQIAAAQETAEVSLRLVDYKTFCAESGRPPPAPLDPGAGYKGWRLP